jgi:Predicted glycosyltransferases
MQKENDDLKISIIILNWNNWKDTLNCLKSIFQIENYTYHLIIVDNYSNDGSVEEIRNHALESFPSEMVEIEIINNSMKINGKTLGLNDSNHHLDLFSKQFF